MSYIIGKHKLMFAAVVICILVSAGVVVVSSLYLQMLIDDYITPMMTQSHPVFDGLLRSILTMMIIYIMGVLATFIYNRLMVKISQ